MFHVKWLENSRKTAARYRTGYLRQCHSQKNGSLSHISIFLPRALKVDVKTKKWGTLLCAGETATQRLRALYVAMPMYGHNGAKGTRERMVVVTTLYIAACTCTLVKEAGG